MSDPPATPALRRVLGLPDVVLMGINGVIGSGIFLLPGKAANLMGPAALAAFLLAAAVCFLIALCFAEAGARFSRTGGAYLYAREAFGGFAGYSVGWMTWWVRIIAWAALANGFAIAFLALFYGPEEAPTWLSQGIKVVLVLGLSWVNLRGARWGASLMNAATVAKFLPLVAFLALGALWARGEPFTPFAPQGYGNLGQTTLLLLWSFVGFELLAIPAGEMKNPVRAVPLAFLVVMGVVTIVYLGVYAVATGTYDGLAGSENPVAEAAASFMGPLGGTLMAAGIAVSIFATNAASALVTPRSAYALAERGQVPAVLGRLHPVHATPAVAIATSATIVIGLSLSGSFEQLAVISVVSRFFQYVPTCAAVLVFRARDRRAGRRTEGFRAPLGPVVPVLALVACTVLLALTEGTSLLLGSAAFLLGIPFYFVFRDSAPRAK